MREKDAGLEVKEEGREGIRKEGREGYRCSGVDSRNFPAKLLILRDICRV